MADLSGHRPFDGVAWSHDLNLEAVRRIDAAVQKGEQNRGRMEAEISALANEERLYEILINGPEGQHGWQTNKQPVHRVAEINRPTADVWRQQAREYPLTNRIITYGNEGAIEWFQHRPVWVLTPDELFSDVKYLAVYEGCVGRGQCSPIEFPLNPPDEEPSRGELYLMHKGLRAGWDTGRFSNLDRQARRDISGLLVALTNWSMPLWDVLEMTYQGEPDGLTLEQRIDRMAQVVPELGRLAEWITARQKAA